MFCLPARLAQLRVSKAILKVHKTKAKNKPNKPEISTFYWLNSEKKYVTSIFSRYQNCTSLHLGHLKACVNQSIFIWVRPLSEGASQTEKQPVGSHKVVSIAKLWKNLQYQLALNIYFGRFCVHKTVMFKDVLSSKS